MNRIIENYFNKKDIVYCKPSRKKDMYEIPLCISEVLKSYGYCAFKLTGIPPNKKLHDSFALICIIHHCNNTETPDADPEVFLPEMTLKVNESEFDPECRNFGNLLAKYLKLPTRNSSFRNGRVHLDTNRSENFSPGTVFDKPLELFILHQDSDHLYNFVLDWPSRIAIFKIPMTSVSTFVINYFSEQITE